MLDIYIDTSVKVIMLENTVFDMKEEIRDRRKLKNSVIKQLDNCLSTSELAISNSIAASKEKTAINQYAQKSKEFLKKYIEDGKVKFSDEVFKEISDYEQKINSADKENRVTLESFFVQDPLPVIFRNFIIKATKDGYSGKNEKAPS